jgi:fructokinase
MGSCEFGWCHVGNKKPSWGRVERTHVSLRALLDKQDYVGGEKDPPHVGYEVNNSPGELSRSSLRRPALPGRHGPRFSAVGDVYGTVELGGTKTSFAAAGDVDELSDVLTIPTTDPEATLSQVVAYFTGRGLAAVGIASFGPLELRHRHPNYGMITSTPKPLWGHSDVVGPFVEALDTPVGFDTDVNGAALGESRWGAGRGMETVVYVTVGTGIGGGAIIGGAPIHGLGHPEMGHMSVPRRPGDEFAGVCPFHGDCLEGMASGPALAARFGSASDDLVGATLHDARALVAHYLIEMAANLVYSLAPERIIIGGGVGGMEGLIEMVDTGLAARLGGYPGWLAHGSGFVVAPGLGSLSGLAGGLVLAEEAVISV